MLHLSTETYNNEQVSKVFIGRISAQTCQIWIILVINSPNRQILGALPSPRLDSMNRECARDLDIPGMCRDPTPIEYFWLIQMLGNFRAKRNLYSYFIPYVLPPLLSKKRFPATEKGWYLSTLQINSAFLKKIGILLAT